MVDLVDELYDRIFNILADWEDDLEHIDFDFEELQP